MWLSVDLKNSEPAQDRLEEEEMEKTMEQYRQQLDGLLSG